MRQLQKEAQGYLELGMHRHALTTLDRLTDDESLSDTTTLMLRAEALRSLHQFDEALAPLLRVADRDPDAVDARMAIGWCQKRLGRLDLAIEALEEAAKAEPYNALVQYNLACYFSLQNDKSRAMTHLAHALAIEPDLRKLIDEESDFDNVRSDPDFKALHTAMTETAPPDDKRDRPHDQ